MKFCHMKSVLTSFLNAKEVKKARLKLGNLEREKQEIVGTLNELFGKKVGALTMQELNFAGKFY